VKLAAFFRHGLVSRPKGIYSDENDVALSDEGRLQVAKLGPLLRGFQPDRIVVSPVRRCVETAEILGPFFNTSFLNDGRLRERCFPSLFGRTFSEISLAYGVHFVDLLHRGSEKVFLPGEETIEEAMYRVNMSVTQHIRTAKERVLFISHGGPHSWLLCILLGLGADSIRKFTLNEAQLSLLEFNNEGAFKRIILLNADGQTMQHQLQLLHMQGNHQYLG
jgi:broad specificity phosphatase PhoE